MNKEKKLNPTASIPPMWRLPEEDAFWYSINYHRWTKNIFNKSFITIKKGVKNA